MIYTIISILIALYALKDYKKSIILFAVYQIIWYPTVVFNIGNFRVGTNAIMPFWYFVLYFFNNIDKKNSERKIEFPFIIPFALILISSMISCFTAISGFQTEFARFLTRLFSIYIFVWLLWKNINSKEDFRYVFEMVTLVMFSCCVYGLIEYITKTNVVLDYKVILSDNNITLYDASGVRGYRLSSFFEHPIGASMTFGLYCVFYLSLLFKNDDLVKNNKLAMVTAFLCVPCVVLTKMRTGIMFLIISFIILLLTTKLKKETIKKIVIGALFVSPVLIILVCTNIGLFRNLITSNTSSEVGGSSLEMRLSQFEAITHVVSDSPIFGLGETFRNNLTRTIYTDRALGYEGLIFEKWIMYGCFGLFIHLFFVVYSVIIVPKKYKSKEMYFLFIPYWLAYLFSSLPSFRIPLLYIFSFYYLKKLNDGEDEQ